MRSQLLLGVLLLGYALLAGCDGGDSASPQGNAGGSGGTNPSGTGGSGANGGGHADAHGFTIRTPTSRSITCAGGPHTFDDQDWICTFNYGAAKGFVYVQATPVSCLQNMSATPIFSAVAQLSLAGQVTSLDNAAYDWGGNHHNDMLSFTYSGNGYNYYHSSFGFGWRACHNMDCLQVSVGATGTVTDDGCTAARTLPQVCSPINADGTYADLSTDTFAWCPGDPNHS